MEYWDQVHPMATVALGGTATPTLVQHSSMGDPGVGDRAGASVPPWRQNKEDTGKLRNDFLVSDHQRWLL